MHHGRLPQCTTVPTQNAPQCPPDAPIPTDALVSPGSPASHCDFMNFPPGIKEVLSRKPQDTYTEILIGVSSSVEPVEPCIGPGLPQCGAGCSAEPVVPRTSQPPPPAPGQQHHVMSWSPSGRIAPHRLQTNNSHSDYMQYTVYTQCTVSRTICSDYCIMILSSVTTGYVEIVQAEATTSYHLVVY